MAFTLLGVSAGAQEMAAAAHSDSSTGRGPMTFAARSPARLASQRARHFSPCSGPQGDAVEHVRAERRAAGGAHRRLLPGPPVQQGGRAVPVQRVARLWC